jgi:TonB-like protein
MLWIAFAALTSLPVPINARLPDIRAIFTADDVPEYLIEAGASTTRVVYPRIVIRPDGSLQSCVAEISSGDPKLDAYTCALIIKRARWKPATWTDGTPVYGVIRVPVSWMISDAPLSDEDILKTETPDLELSVNQLPKGAHSIVDVSLEIAVDQNGRLLTCDEWPHLKNDHTKQFPELVPVACQQVMTKLSASPPVDPSGQKVRSVQNVSVHFIVNR